MRQGLRCIPAVSVVRSLAFLVLYCVLYADIHHDRYHAHNNACCAATTRLAKPSLISKDECCTSCPYQSVIYTVSMARLVYDWYFRTSGGAAAVCAQLKALKPRFDWAQRTRQREGRWSKGTGTGRAAAARPCLVASRPHHQLQVHDVCLPLPWSSRDRTQQSSTQRRTSIRPWAWAE